MSDSFQALRRANPHSTAGFDDAVQAVAETVRARVIAGTHEPRVAARPRPVVAAAVGAIVVAACVLAVWTIASPGGGSGVGDATAAVRKAAALSAASAERSGTAVVRITHDGELWAGTTIRWSGDDLSLSANEPRRAGRPGSGLLVVDGMMYGVEDGHWVELGSPASIDPDSGTTPAEYLAAVREDVGGASLRRIGAAMTRPTAAEVGSGSTIYGGSVAASLIARETGFKEGRSIRVLAFGYVAHGAAADAAARVDVAMTVGADGIVRQLAVSWPGWRYTVAYTKLGATPPPAAPQNAAPFPDRTP